MPAIDDICRELIAQCQKNEWTLATAESLTGGMICSTLCDIDGASTVVRGGVVAYWSDIKRDVLNVDADRLAERGAVDPVVCEQMATGVAEHLQTDVAIAATGVAGPAQQDGHPVGEVHIGVFSPKGFIHRQLDLHGGRNEIRRQAADEALKLALQFVSNM